MGARKGKPANPGNGSQVKAPRTRKPESSSGLWRKLIERNTAVEWPSRKSETRCIRCGCTDLMACPGGCYWLAEDTKALLGICSGCLRPHERLKLVRFLREDLRAELRNCVLDVVAIRKRFATRGWKGVL